MAPSFEEEDVAPDAVTAAEPLADADDAEAAALVERDARDVLGKDPCLDGPDTVQLGPLDEPGEEHAPDVAAARGGRHVDAVLRHPRVDAAVGNRRERRPAEDLAGQIGHEPMAGEVRGVPCLP